MAYKLGDMYIEDPKKYGSDYVYYDPRDDDKPRKEPFACLPHSCEAWVIGGPAEIRTMIADLEAALSLLENGEDAQPCRTGDRST